MLSNLFETASLAFWVLPGRWTDRWGSSLNCRVETNRFQGMQFLRYLEDGVVQEHGVKPLFRRVRPLAMYQPDSKESVWSCLATHLCRLLALFEFVLIVDFRRWLQVCHQQFVVLQRRGTIVDRCVEGLWVHRGLFLRMALISVDWRQYAVTLLCEDSRNVVSDWQWQHLNLVVCLAGIDNKKREHNPCDVDGGRGVYLHLE